MRFHQLSEKKYLFNSEEVFPQNSLIKIVGENSVLKIVQAQKMPMEFVTPITYTYIVSIVKEYWTLDGQYHSCVVPNFEEELEFEVLDRATVYPYSADVLELEELWGYNLVTSTGKTIQGNNFYTSLDELTNDLKYILSNTRFGNPKLGGTVNSEIIGYKVFPFIGFNARVRNKINLATRAGARNFGLSKLFELERSKDLSDINKRFNRLTDDTDTSTTSEDKHDGRRDDTLDTGPSIWD
jgi:hypothetical protein